MATHLTPEEMKAFVRQHFEDFVNNKKEITLLNFDSNTRRDEL